MPAALPAQREDGTSIRLHVSTRLPADLWVVEPRQIEARAGETLRLPGGATVRLLVPYTGSRRLWVARFDVDVPALLQQHGRPIAYPYVYRQWPIEMYQTVYAATPGAVAAPTAGLHFDRALLARIEQRGAKLAAVTLHVGAGTFQPVRCERVEEHRMHNERYAVPPATMEAIAGRRVLAVGTTSLRAMESAVRLNSLQGETDLFIYPGFRFRVVDRLLTNFHLPKSTLLMLVSAFAGKENILRAYEHAIARRYRFFSYGDAMLIEK